MDKAATANPRHFCTFRLGDRLLGFDIHLVKEVNTYSLTTPVPHAPPEVMGYLNLRGSVFLILDLRRVLGMSPAVLSADSRFIIFKPNAGDAFGVLVDRIAEIVSLDVKSIETWRPELDDSVESIRATELIAGIGKLEQDLLIMLRAEGLLRAAIR